MNMKFLFLLWMIWMPFFHISAQEELNAEESRKMITAICDAASKIVTLQCDFKQDRQLSLLKTVMQSQGKMYYKGGKLLRWEYISPYTYTFILNGDKVMLKSSQKTDVLDVKSSKMFQQIARIMMNSVTGKCLSDAKDFEVTMYATKQEWIAKLVPRQKELQQLFDYIRLHIDADRQMVVSVELIEKNGDTTTIEMVNVKKNMAVDDAIYSVK